MKNNLKAFIGMVIGVLTEGIILEGFSDIPRIWYYQIPILILFNLGLMLFVQVGRWVQLSWAEEKKNK